MKRTNVAAEFASLQRESQRAIELLGDLMTEPGSEPIERQRPQQFALVVQRQPVLRYLGTS